MIPTAQLPQLLMGRCTGRFYVYQPVDPNNSSPVVVFFYGGNWDSGDRRDY